MNSTFFHIIIPIALLGSIAVVAIASRFTLSLDEESIQEWDEFGQAMKGNK